MKHGKWIYDPKPEKREKKKREPIKRLSDKRKKENAEYLRLNKIYLAEHPVCEVKDCVNKSNQVHHKMGRTGKLLIDVRYFMAVCSKCHERIEMNVLWAKENNYSINRI